MLEGMKSLVVVDKELAMTDREEARVDAMAEKFEELALLEELTAREGMVGEEGGMGREERELVESVTRTFE